MLEPFEARLGSSTLSIFTFYTLGISCFLPQGWTDDGIFLPLAQYGLLWKQRPAPHVDQESDGYQEMVERITRYDVAVLQHKYLLIDNEYLLLVLERFKHVF